MQRGNRGGDTLFLRESATSRFWILESLTSNANQFPFGPNQQTVARDRRCCQRAALETIERQAAVTRARDQYVSDSGLIDGQHMTADQ